MKFNLYLSLVLIFSSYPLSALSQGTLTGQVNDAVVEAQEKLQNARGSYKTVKDQEKAVGQMRNATKLNLRASKLRAKAEKLQTKADILLNKASQTALSRGLYITNPLLPMMMQPPPQTASRGPVPGNPINIIVPRQEEVSYDENSNYLPNPPVPGNY